MSSYSLVVIDMQSKFLDSLPTGRVIKVLSSCQSLVRKAKKEKAAIIFVEFSDWEATHNDLKKLVTRYPKAGYLIKSEMDGSVPIDRWIRHYGLPKNLKICGVYTDQCVYFTTKGLHSYDYKIEVVENACGAESHADHNYGIEKFDKLGVKVNLK